MNLKKNTLAEVVHKMERETKNGLMRDLFSITIVWYALVRINDKRMRTTKRWSMKEKERGGG